MYRPAIYCTGWHIGDKNLLISSIIGILFVEKEKLFFIQMKMFQGKEAKNRCK